MKNKNFNKEGKAIKKTKNVLSKNMPQLITGLAQDGRIGREFTPSDENTKITTNS